jgi:hypothetical protein
MNIRFGAHFMKSHRFVVLASWLLVGCSESTGSVGPDEAEDSEETVDAGDQTDSVESVDAGAQTDVSAQVDRNLYIPCGRSPEGARFRSHASA